MTAYYNENNPFLADWLMDLIDKGLIADGVVDNRSIVDVEPGDVEEFTQCHFFAGIGGWSLALRLAKWSDSRPVWTGSPPCQPFSNASPTRSSAKGVNDERHLSPNWISLIGQCRPPTIFGEQVAAAITKDNWLDTLQDELESTNYAVGSVTLPACSVFAPHLRQRIWFVGKSLADTHSHGVRSSRSECFDSPQRKTQSGEKEWEWIRSDSLAEHDNIWPVQSEIFWENQDLIECQDGYWRPIEPGTLPVDDGLPGRLELIRGYGNAIVPQVAAEVVKAFMSINEEAVQ